MILPVDRARELRRRSTEAEKRLWHALRRRELGGLKSRRQQPIDRYVVDFVCFEARLIIEVDGGQHGPEVDAPRTANLERRGYRVLRFWNNEVMENLEGVLQTIGAAAPSPGARRLGARRPLPPGER